MTILRKEQTYVDSFLRFIQQEKGLSKNTIKAYLQDINFFLRWTQFKKVSIADINEVSCEDFIFHLRDKGLSPVSISRKMSALKTFFNYLIKQKTGKLDKDNAKEIINKISEIHNIKKGILMKSLRVAFFGSLSGPDLIQSWELFSESKTDISRIQRCLKLI